MNTHLVIIFYLLVIEAVHPYYMPLDQGRTLLNLKYNNDPALLTYNESINTDNTLFSQLNYETKIKKQDHLIKGLPGQPSSELNFNQYAGEISVNGVAGRALFYYFVESATNSSSTDPLILWLNGGPGCSSLGMGALIEIGPFGVNPDGQTLYSREFAWNKVANVLFLESPVGVGFSYSNTTSDYNTTGDQSTAEDAYIFLLKWFEMYPTFKGRDFYLIGESYAGYYIPELADIILENIKSSRNLNPMINLQGIMIGNGLIDDETFQRGAIDYLWSHALVSQETREDFSQNCFGGKFGTPPCKEAYLRLFLVIHDINVFDLYTPTCEPSLINHPPTNKSHPCDMLYVQSYLNLPQVQAALNANTTKLPYTWTPCSYLLRQWHDRPSSMFSIYKKLMGHGLRILLYSGDVDACVPFTTSLYAISAMGLKVIKPWHSWAMSNTSGQVAGFKVVYDGLTYTTVLGAGHQVSLSYPDRLFHLLNDFVGR